MNFMLLAFNAVFPLLAFMMTGFFLRKVKLLDKKTASGMNKLVFKVFLPLSIFNSIYNADIRSDFDLKVALYVACTCILSFIVISFLVSRREKDLTIRPVMIQGLHKANYNLLVIPIVTSFYGNNMGMTAVLVAIITPIVNICSTITFEAARREAGREQNSSTAATGAVNMIKKIILNPLVLSSLLGILANISGIKIPSLLMNSIVSKLGAMATPAAMLALGSDFDFRAFKKWANRLCVVIIGKLFILPVILVTGAALLGIRDANLIAVLVYSGSHTAVNSYSTAVSMGGNEELAGELVAVTSLLSVFTLFVFLTVLGSLGLLG